MPPHSHSGLPPPTLLSANDSILLWSLPIREQLAYFHANKCPLYEDITDGNHAKPTVYDFAASFISAQNPVVERTLLAQRLILKQLFVIRVLTQILPPLSTQYNFIHSHYSKSTRYTPIETPLPSTILQTILPVAENLFVEYNRVYMPQELEKMKDQRYIHDLLQTFEYAQSLHLQVCFYHRELIWLQSLEHGNQHGLFSALSNGVLVPRGHSSVASAKELKESRRDSMPVLSLSPSNHSSASISPSPMMGLNFNTNGGFVPEDLRYTQSLEKMWFLWVRYHRYQYQLSLQHHCDLHPNHLEINPLSPSSPIGTHQKEIASLIQNRRPFSLRVLGINLDNFFLPNSSIPKLPPQYAVISEPMIYSTCNIALHDFDQSNPLWIMMAPSAGFDLEFESFSNRRSHCLSIITQTSKQPPIEELTRDTSLLSSLFCGIEIPPLPSVAIAYFLPNLDKLMVSWKEQHQLVEYNRTITTRSALPYPPSQLHFYLSQSPSWAQYQLLLQQLQAPHPSSQSMSSVSQSHSRSLGQRRSLPELFGNISFDATASRSGFNSSSNNEDGKDAGDWNHANNGNNGNNKDGLVLTEAQLSIPPTAFFTLLLGLQRKQSLYKAFPTHRSQPFVCKLHNKSLLGGKDLKKDLQNVQSLVLKHFSLIELLTIHHKRILADYTEFAFGTQHEPALQEYLRNTAALRQRFCPLPTPIPPSLPPSPSTAATSTSASTSTLPSTPTSTSTSLSASSSLRPSPDSLLDWSTLPPDPLNSESQRWLAKALVEIHTDFGLFHKPLWLFEKDEIVDLVSTLFTDLLPRSYRTIHYLKRQCFYMTEEVLIFQSLLDENFMFTWQQEHPELIIETLVTQFNTHFLSQTNTELEAYKSKFVDKHGKFQKDKYDKDLGQNGIEVTNDPNFWTAANIAGLIKDHSSSLSLRALVISDLDEKRLQFPEPKDVVDLDQFVTRMKSTAGQTTTDAGPVTDRWLQEQYPQTWTCVNRPPLPASHAIKPILHVTTESIASAPISYM